MNIHPYISNDVEALSLSTKSEDAKSLFERLTFTHIPIVDDGQLLGCLCENDSRGFENGKILGDYQYALDHFSVHKGTNWLDVLETFAQNETNIVPVLDDVEKYIGYYELVDILSQFNETPFLNEAGGILIVEKGIKDYSFSEVTQIVESNNGKVLGLFISEIREDVVQITMKIAQQGLNEIIQTFRRYSYQIISGVEDDTYLEDLKERSEYLNKYLNI
ncbi:CBS domain-containing protein [Sungkyunkwania multivorans]|uniref:CBS domain-containing protein n=1 Tax=Sungkyunkwania multivorans TaxID=1173618 RepID=A0ABW3D0S0_9FLAO